MKKLFIVFVIFVSFYAKAQVTPGGKFDTIFDKEGQKYALLDLAINPLLGSTSANAKPPATSSCSAGYFDLYFSNASIFSGPNGPNYKNIVCTVFNDISNFLISPLSASTNTTKVNIFVDETLTPGLGGTGSSFYVMPIFPSSPNPGLATNAIFKTITSGQDAYSGVVSSIFTGNGFYHGQINLGQTINWNFNLGTSIVPSGQIDLYTVILHEALHACGFASLMDFNGVSRFGVNNNYYDRYDMFLHNSASFPLLTTTAPTNSITNLIYSGPVTQINPGNCVVSGNSNITACPQAARFIGNSINVGVYTPNCYESGSSLSHFEELCSVPASFNGTCPVVPPGSNNDLYYVMSNANSAGNCSAKRYPKEEERIALCNIGYNVNSNYTSIAVGGNYTYTNNTCNPLQIFGVNDGYINGSYTYTGTTTINIPISAVLGNDSPNTGLTANGLSFVYNMPGLSLSVTGGSISIINTSGYCGSILLQYVPTNSSGQMGNVTYIYANFICSTTCNVGMCDIVQNGGFESLVTNTCSPFPLAGTMPQLINCWDRGGVFSNSPDIFNSSSLACPIQNQYNIGHPNCIATFGLNSTYNGNNNTIALGLVQNEFIKNKLSTPLVPTNTYVVSGWVYLPKGQPWSPFNATGDVVLSIASAQSFSNAINAPSYPFYPTPYQSIANFTVPFSSVNNWQFFTTTFVFNSLGNVSHDCIILGIDLAATASTPNPPVSNPYIIVDDISILPINSYIPLNLPNAICAQNSYTNLSQYLGTNAPFTGSFFGTGLTQPSPGQFDFNNPPILPFGTYNLTHTYTINSGCSSTVNTLAYVSGVSTQTNATTCSSGNYTLNATAFAPGTTFNWQPGGATTSSIAVNVTNTTIFTLTASNGSCTAQYTTAINIPTLSISPVPPICINSSSGFLQTYLSAVTPTTGAFLGPNLINGNCGGNICSYIDLAITPQPAPGVYTYSYVVPTNTSIGIFCTKTITYNVTYLPPFTTSISALPTGTNCFTSGQTYTLVANPNPLGSINYTWFPGGNTTSSIVITPTTNVVYTVFTDNGFCSASATLAVNPNPPITFTNLPTNWCTYQTYYMEDYLAAGTPTGGTWSGTNMGTFYQNQIFGGTNIDVNPVLTSLGTQTVTYCYTSPTNSLCNVCNQFTVNINQGFQLNASGSAVLCANISTLQTNIGVAVTFTGTGNPLPISYSWTPSGLTTASINVTPAVNTTYTCIATSVAGCTAINTVSVSVSNSCCISNNYISGSTIGAPGATTTINGFYALNQNVTLDGLVYLSGEFAIAPNVKITVAPNATLQTAGIADAPGLHLYACSDMWTGIEITNTGKLFMNTGGDLIEDAIVAVRSNGSTTTNTLTPDITIVGAAFNRNRTGVSIENYTQPVNPAPFIIENSVFTCRDLAITPGTGTWPFAINLNAVGGSTNALSSPYLVGGYTPVNLKAPFANIPCYAGVYVENSGTIANPVVSPSVTSVLIGNKTATGNGLFNLFDNLMFGIFGEGSNIESQNNTFQNSRRVILCTPRCRIRGGYGIYAKSNYVTYSNNVLNCTHPSLASNNGRINKFYDCYIGIGADYMYNVDVQYADFRSNQYTSPPSPLNITGFVGVQIITNKVKAYKVSFNLMQNIYNGIAANLSPYFMALPGVPAYGLYLGQVSINSNTIVPKLAATTAAGVPRVYHAIYAGNSFFSGASTYTESLADFRIQKNTLGNVWRGVQVIGFNFGGYVATVAQNSINMVVDPNTQPQYGVYSAANYANAINTNSISGFNITNTLVAGVYASMNSGPSNTATALNSIRCNTLTNMFIGFDFESYNGASIWRNNDMQTLRRGLYIGNNGAIGQQGTATAASDNRWLGSWTGRFATFTDNSSAINSKLFTQSTAIFNPFFYPNSGNPVFTSYSLTMGAIVTGAIPNLFNCTTGTGGGGGGGGGGGSNASQREALLTDLASDNLTFTLNPSETREIVKNSVFTDMEIEPPLATVNSTLSTFSATNNSPATFGKYKTIEQKLSSGQLALAQSIIAAFSPTTNIENNYKTFYTLQRAYLQNQDLTLLENIQLLLLAYQCPFTDGQVVYNARALYNLVNQTILVYNDNNCSSKGFSFRELNDSATSNTPEQEELLQQLIVNEKVSKEKFKYANEYVLFPNPAYNEFSIFTNQQQENLQVTITDVNGKVLISKKLATENYSTKFNFNLINGIYFVNILNEQREKTVKKLVVTH